jgi:predicted porin
MKYLPIYRSGTAIFVCKTLCILVMIQSNVGFAQDSEIKSEDSSLTWRGITLYGSVDIGLQYETHGAPISPYYVGGTAPFITKYSNHSVFGMTPSNLSQSKLGLEGVEALIGDWSAVFNLESYFNPQSGEISDGLKALAQNNGRTLDAQSSGLDSSIAGQPFQTSYIGLKSSMFGLITLGRSDKRKRPGTIDVRELP